MLFNARPRLISAARYFSSNSNIGRLAGKTIVVCGAANDPSEEFGVGKMTALVCARKGANVVAVSRNQARVDATIADIRRDLASSAMEPMETQEFLAVEADCTSYSDVETLVATTAATFPKGVDSVIQAGVYDAQPNGFSKLSPERWHQSIDVNLHAQYNLIHLFLPQLLSAADRQDGGSSVLFVSTIAASVGLGLGPQRHGYAAGKAAAGTLTQRIGIEYASRGLRGNVIEAGYIASPLVQRAVNAATGDADANSSTAIMEAVTAKRDGYVPRGTQGKPIDVAYACAWLASDEAAFINGVTLPVDGGTSSLTYGP